MRLFNFTSLLKVSSRSVFEMFLHKAAQFLYSQSGHVKFRGNRYIYQGRDVVRFDGDDDCVQITLLTPFTAIDAINNGSVDEMNNTMGIMSLVPGSCCDRELAAVTNHIRWVNEKHYLIEAVSLLAVAYSGSEEKNATNM